MNFLIGIFLVAAGAASLVYHQQVFNMTGRIDFVERRLPGGSSSFLKLMGVLAVFLGLLFATGLGSWLTAPINDGIQDVFSPINADY
jgi:hypothetical protein